MTSDILSKFRKGFALSNFFWNRIPKVSIPKVCSVIHETFFILLILVRAGCGIKLSVIDLLSVNNNTT